jgi:DNA polymerase III delta prime subunit
MLVLTSPSIVDPLPGPAPVISDLIRQAFPDQVQRDVFTGWLAGSYRSVRDGIHHPAPMLCLAGKPNTGKSLLSYLVKRVMGGRSANPHTAWTGSLPWNDNLCAAELLLLDDCQGSTDIRSRMNFASNFKEAIYSGDVDMKKRHCSSMSVRPVWRVMVCCNDNSESLLILPPIGCDMADKVILLKVEPIVTPIDTSHTEGRKLLQRMIEDELPMLAGYLTRFELPDDLRDSRSGVLAWRHPDLTQAIESTKPESRLEELLQTALDCHLWNDLPRIMTASEIEGRLIDRDSPVRDQVKATLTWNGACGTYLSRLATSGSSVIENAEFDAHNKRPRYYVRKP